MYKHNIKSIIKSNKIISLFYFQGDVINVRKKIYMIVLGIVALAVVGAVILLPKNPEGDLKVEGMITGKADEMGIQYGGNFNEFEFQYSTQEDTEETEITEPDEIDQGEDTIIDTIDIENNIEPEGLDIDESAGLEELSAEVERIKEEFNQNKQGDILSHNAQENEVTLVKQAEVKQSDTMNSDEELDMNQLGIPVIQSSGYAEHEVLCDAETQEIAESIATQISGSLLSWQNGVAKIKIEESVDDLLLRLESEGSDLELYRRYYVK